MQTLVEVIAPEIGGVTLSDGTKVPAQQNMAGGLSVLYDAVVMLVTEEGVLLHGHRPEFKDFINDAYSHFKFIGFVDALLPAFKKFGLPEKLDGGFFNLQHQPLNDFITACGQLRYWQRHLQ